ncbi:L,D-transpeptidase [Patescibacteria group bacterium]
MKRFLTFCFALIVAISVYVCGIYTVSAQDYKTPQPNVCSYAYQDDVNLAYDYEYLGSRKKLIAEPGGYESVTLYFQNTGTIPMFSDDSGCSFRPLTRLGTGNERDRESILFTLYSAESEDTGWISPNRIKLDQEIVRPGERGSFTFTMKAPLDNALYREYFDIVIEGTQWIEKPFAVNFDIGEFFNENREYIKFVGDSRRIDDATLLGEKSIEVDISDQRMFLKIGDITVREFPISTGKWSTPTPYGYTQIYYKQEVRVGAAWPHYIMPKWMNFRHNGYGIHALPSISFDNGYFWTEALNHIGQARSHGCIRLLPNDAEFAYDFTPVGTSVWVHG